MDAFGALMTIVHCFPMYISIIPMRSRVPNEIYGDSDPNNVSFALFVVKTLLVSKVIGFIVQKLMNVGSLPFMLTKPTKIRTLTLTAETHVILTLSVPQP